MLQDCCAGINQRGGFRTKGGNHFSNRIPSISSLEKICAGERRNWQES